MRHEIYALRDNKSEFYHAPIFVLDEAQAIRFFSMQLKNEQSMFLYASDYTIYKIGTFDNNSGRIIQISDTSPVEVCRMDVVRSELKKLMQQGMEYRSESDEESPVRSAD